MKLLFFNIILFLIFRAFLYAMDLIAKHSVDKFRKILFSFISIYSTILFTSTIVSILGHESLGIVIAKILCLTIWLCQTLWVLKNNNTNKVTVIYSKITDAPVRTVTKSGLTLMFPGYRGTLSDSGHDEEVLDDKIVKQEITVPGLQTEDWVTFDLKITFWSQLETARSAEIRNFTGGVAGLRHEISNYFSSIAKKHDGAYKMDTLIKDPVEFSKFCKEIEVDFRDAVGEENDKEPILIAPNIITFELIPSKEYLALKEKVKDVEYKKNSEQLGIKKQDEIIFEMIDRASAKGIKRTYEECLKQLQLENNPNVSENHFNNSGTGTTIAQVTNGGSKT